MKLEAVADGEEGGPSDVEYDEESKTVRIPLSAMDGGRRTKLVMFTCNKCGGRSARLVNPLAWEKGAVFCQCQRCGVWHTLAANNPKIIEEIRYDDPEGQRRRREELYREAFGGGGGAAAADSSDASDATGFAGGGAGDDDGGASSRPSC